MIARDLTSALAAWKDRPGRMPALVYGARQVGKTWLLREFGRTHFSNTVYVNFDRDQTAKQLFTQDLIPTRILRELQNYTGETITAGQTLIIWDEIQECPPALTALKYFCEDAPEYHLAVAGSLLGLIDHQGTGFPVGKVDIFNLFPCSFGEFLGALAPNMRQIVKNISSADHSSLSIYRSQLRDLLRQYFVVGGMPAAVQSYVTHQNISEVRRIQNQILAAYQMDISKHASVRDAQAANDIWRALPQFLARENKKFIFGHTREAARAKDLMGGLLWLEQAGLITRVPRISKPGLPLSAYQDRNSFKAFCLDVGLLGAMSGLEEQTIVAGNQVFTEFKGALTEQYVCQELQVIAAKDTPGMLHTTPSYWSAPKGNAEIDFLTVRHEQIYAIEVKAEENLRAKSLRTFKTANPHLQALRFSLADFREQDWMRNIPLYALAQTELW